MGQTHFSGLASGSDYFTKHVVVSTITDASAATYTAAQLLGGLILRDPAGGARSDVTPTAAAILAALDAPVTGQAFEFTPVAPTSSS